MINVQLTIFFDDDRLDAVATTAQARTYRLLQSCFAESRKVTVSDLLRELGITKPKTFYSRLDHLQAKGLVFWNKSTPANS